MRVPTSSNSTAMLAQVQTVSERQSRLQTQVATQQRIFQPEDDPAAVGRYLTLDAERRQITQYITNSDYALDLTQATYSGIQAIKKLSDRAGELATLGAGSISADASTAYAAEVDQLLEQALLQVNSRLRNDYIFAGTAVDTPPFSATRDAAGKITGVSYVGNSTQTSVQISDTASIAPGSTGDTNTKLGDFINHLVQLRDALNSGATANVSAAQSLLEGDEDNIVSAMSENGAVQLRIEVSQSQSKERLANVNTLISGETSVNLPEAITKLSQASLAYEAALQSMSQIMNVSLLDYVR
ncbi:MAG TPA: flagellin [Opitutaceae bacterium]|nr:flagellin [Opitutaceae bacterium]